MRYVTVHYSPEQNQNEKILAGYLYEYQGKIKAISLSPKHKIIERPNYTNLAMLDDLPEYTTGVVHVTDEPISFWLQKVGFITYHF